MSTYDRLSALDASFLHLETLETPMHVGAMSILEGEPFFDADGHFRIIQRTHHSLIDGVSGVDVATLLLDATSSYERPIVPAWRPEPAPGPSQLLVDSLLERITEPAEIIRSVRSMLRGPRRAA